MSLSGRPVGRRIGRAPKMVGEERRCHCGTLLSIYNPGPNCWLHAGRKRRRVRGWAGDRGAS